MTTQRAGSITFLCCLAFTVSVFLYIAVAEAIQQVKVVPLGAPITAKVLALRKAEAEARIKWQGARKARQDYEGEVIKDAGMTRKCFENSYSVDENGLQIDDNHDCIRFDGTISDDAKFAFQGAGMKLD